MIHRWPLPFSEHQKPRHLRDESKRAAFASTGGVRKRAGKPGTAGIPAKTRVALTNARKRTWLRRVAAKMAAALLGGRE